MTGLTIEQVVEREAIADVIKRVARGTDRIDREVVLSCYHSGATEEHGHFIGPATEFVEFICGDRSGRFAATTHQVGAPVVRFDGDIATADTPCVAHCITVADELGVQHDFVSGVRYVDTLSKSAEGEWLIEKRVCLLDWTYTVPIDAGILTGLDPAYSGRRDRTDLWYELTRPLGQTA